MNKKVVKKSLFSYILLAAVIVGVIYFFNVLNRKVNDLSYSEFINAMNNGEVTELTITPNGSAGVYQLTGSLKKYKKDETFVVTAPIGDETIKEIYEGRSQYDFDLNTKSDPSSSLFWSFVFNV